MLIVITVLIRKVLVLKKDQYLIDAHPVCSYYIEEMNYYCCEGSLVTALVLNKYLPA